MWTPAVPAFPNPWVRSVFSSRGRAPSITSLSDNAVPSTGVTQLEVNGRGFMRLAKVWFGSAPSPAVIYVSPSLLVAAVPPGHGAVHVIVVTAGGRTPATSADSLDYAPVPVITGVSPASGPVTGGTQVTITGSGLAGTEFVTVGSTVVTDFRVKSGSDVTLTVPAGPLGTVDIGVVTDVGTSAPAPADRFSYVLPSADPGQEAGALHLCSAQ